MTSNATRSCLFFWLEVAIGTLLYFALRLQFSGTSFRLSSVNRIYVRSSKSVTFLVTTPANGKKTIP